MNGLQILSVAGAPASRIVTNDDFAAVLDTSDEWISTRTGIQERRFVDGETNVDLAARAAALALEQAHESYGVDAQEIAVCLVATCSPDDAMPSEACSVASRLGLPPTALCMDVNAACTGFLYALHTAHALLAQTPEKCALVIGSEVLSRLADQTDRSTCVLFGDGAGAAIIRRSSAHAYAFMAGNQPNATALSCPARSGSLQMEGQTVFRFAVETIPHCVQALLQQECLTLADIDAVVCHQANQRILEAAARRLHAPVEKFFMNLQRYGNTSAATIPLALSELAPQAGQRILCVGFGAGLTYGAALLTW